MSGRRNRATVVLALLAVLAASPVDAAPDGRAPAVTCTHSGFIQGGPTSRGTTPALRPAAVRTVATGLCIPWGLVFLPDGTALVTERGDVGPARILTVSPQGRVREVQRIDGVRATGEGGLLGIAVSPRYSSDHWIYIYYSTQTDNRVARLHLGQPPQPIFTGIPAGDFHEGGRIAFGPDGMLYITTGDTFYTPHAAQDRRSLAGKILRITPGGKPAPGNPYPGSAVYSLGHRNVEGLAWDARGRLYASELGEDRCDELNRIRPGGNYGWPAVEGIGRDTRFVDPIARWCPTALASPSGIGILGNHIYIACLRGQRLYRVDLDGRNVRQLLFRAYGRLRTVAVAPDGSLWVMTSNRDGRMKPPSRDDDRIIRLRP